jgi:hypothetical protein
MLAPAVHPTPHPTGHTIEIPKSQPFQTTLLLTKHKAAKNKKQKQKKRGKVNRKRNKEKRSLLS